MQIFHKKSEFICKIGNLFMYFCKNIAQNTKKNMSITPSITQYAHLGAYLHIFNQLDNIFISQPDTSFSTSSAYRLWRIRTMDANPLPTWSI